MPIYLANDKYNSTLTSGYTTGQNVLFVSAVPDNVPTVVVAAKGTDNETVFTVTGKTSNSLTGVARLRGANVNLDATTPVTVLNNSEFVNQYSTAVSSPETLKPLLYAEDGGSTDTYAVSLDPAPASYYAGMVVVFKANTANTGAATLNVNSLGAKTIKKNQNEDLADSDIKANQIVTVVYDGTNFQLVSTLPSGVNPSGTPAQGDILYYNGSTWARLAAGTSGHFLKTQGASANPTWASATATAPPRCRVRRTASQTITTATTTQIAFDAEDFDTDTMHDTATNNTRITIKTAGVYLVTATVAWASNATGSRQAFFHLNGSNTTGTGPKAYASTAGVVGTPGDTITAIAPLAVNDYIELSVRQDSGGNLDVEGGDDYYKVSMSAIYLGASS